MNINMTVERNGDECQFFADIFPGAPNEPCFSALPATFAQRRIYAADKGLGLLTLPLKDAKKMAEEILKL